MAVLGRSIRRCLTSNYFTSLSFKTISRNTLASRSFTSRITNGNSSDNAHQSNAEFLVNNFPVIEIDNHVAVCDGGGGAAGHPIEYIQLDSTLEPGVPQACMYCGLRYKRKIHNHH